MFQLSGGALVVRDVVRAEKNLAWLDYWFAELEHAIGDVDAEQQASRAAEGVESIYDLTWLTSGALADGQGVELRIWV